MSPKRKWSEQLPRKTLSFSEVEDMVHQFKFRKNDNDNRDEGRGHKLVECQAVAIDQNALPFALFGVGKRVNCQEMEEVTKLSFSDNWTPSLFAKKRTDPTKLIYRLMLAVSEYNDFEGSEHRIRELDLSGNALYCLQKQDLHVLFLLLGGMKLERLVLTGCGLARKDFHRRLLGVPSTVASTDNLVLEGNLSQPINLISNHPAHYVIGLRW